MGECKQASIYQVFLMDIMFYTMSKGAKTMIWKPIETADPSKWKLTDFRLTAEEPE